MKTIWDAANELKGDLRGVCASIKRDEIWRNNESDTYIAIKGNPYHRPEIYTFACTAEEFNALVAEMSLGLDVNPINEGYYHEYLDANKELLEPIKQKPIYTQEMCDNVELPPIGSMFIDIELNNEEQVEAIAHDLALGRVIYKRGSTLQDSEYFGAQAHECKPIPPKLDLIDGEAYQYNCDNNTHNGIYDEFKKSMYSVHSITCIEHCTNIKPLTVND